MKTPITVHECINGKMTQIGAAFNPETEKIEMPDNVDHPKHYRSHPSGVEVIQITEHMNFNLGNAVKYILRCDLKGKPIEDLQEAIWYIEREIQRRQPSERFNCKEAAQP